MSFFEFDSESFEASAPPARSASSPGAGRPATKGGGAPTSPRPTTPSSPPRGTTSTPPARTQASTPSKGPGAPPPPRTTPAAPRTGATTATPRTGVTTATPRTGATTAPARTDTSVGGRPNPAPTTPSNASSTARPAFDFSQFTRYIKPAIDFAQFGVQTAQQFAGARGGGAAPARSPGGGQPGEPEPASGVTAPAQDHSASPQVFAPAAPGAVQASGAGGDQLALLLQALQQRQIPPLPGSLPPAAVMPAPMQAPAPQMDGLALLHGILANPQFQQTMQSAAMGGGARNVYLPMPVPTQPQYQQPVPIPLGAVMNAIAQLAGRSMTELNAGTREDDPEVPVYLVDEQGEYVVDPANAEDRAALVAHLFQVTAAATEQVEPLVEMDESESWAREAGFSL